MRLESCLSWSRLPVLALLFAPTAIFASEGVVISDASIDASLPSQNFGSLSQLSIGGGTRALIQFSLTSLPAGVTGSSLSKATLVLYVDTITVPGALDIGLVGGPWSEASVTSATAPPIGAVLGSVVTSTTNYVAVDITSAVANWINSPAGNYGIAVSPSAGAPNTQVYVDSKESSSTSHAARLEITLTGVGPVGPGEQLDRPDHRVRWERLDPVERAGQRG